MMEGKKLSLFSSELGSIIEYERKPSDIKPVKDYTMDYIMYKAMKENEPQKEEIRRMNGLEKIVGKRINGYVISDEETVITFNDDEGTLYIYHADADCCSHSWIENIEDPEYLLGNLVLKVEDKEPESFKEHYECIQVISYDIYTDKGICKIDFRNSSNGYYGGNLQIVEIKKANK